MNSQKPEVKLTAEQDLAYSIIHAIRSQDANIPDTWKSAKLDNLLAIAEKIVEGVPCSCGDRSTAGYVHRSGKPCFQLP